MSELPQPIVGLVADDGQRRQSWVAGLKAAGLTACAYDDLTALDTSKAHVVVLATSELDAISRLATPGVPGTHTPLIVVPASDVEWTIGQALGAGADDVASPSMDDEELVARVQAQLQRRRQLLGLHRRLEGEHLLLELTQALGSTLDLREILSLMVRRIAEVVDVDRVSIVLGDRGDGTETVDDTAYVIAASDDEKLRDLPIRISDYPEIVQVIETNQPVVIRDTEGHALYRLANIEAPTRFRSLTLVPIRFEERPMGVLFLRRERPGTLDEKDMRSLGALANAAGIALRNAQLWLTLRERSRQSQFAHHRAESQIKELKRYVDFFDSSADGILVVDRAGRLAFCNPAACHITGRDHEALRGSSFLDVLCEDGHHRFLQLRDRVKDGEAFGNEDLPIDLPNGQRRVLNVSVNNMLNAHGGLIVSFRDVTEDRAIARELTKTKEFLQCVIDSSVDAIVSADMNGTVVLFNPAAERIYGYQAHEVVGLRNVRSLYPNDRAFSVMKHIQSREYGGHGVLQGYETQLLGRAGEIIPVQLSASLIIHRDRPIGSVGVFKDLRAKHQIEAQLAQTQEELQKQEKKTLIAELAGATAHELNQPLTAVMGYADMLLRQIDDESRLGKIARSVMSETERMAEIVRKIGKLTKYETKAYVGDTKIIDIERSIESEPPLDSHLTETYESSSRRPGDPTPNPNDR